MAWHRDMLPLCGVQGKSREGLPLLSLLPYMEMCMYVCAEVTTDFLPKQEISRDHIPRAVTNLFIKAS